LDSLHIYRTRLSALSLSTRRSSDLCLEEHFPHSMAKAVVQEAKRRGLEHEEMHSKVEYTVAHGISSWIDGRKVVIGSAHFVFERSEEHTSELQSRFDLVCRLLLENT